MAIFFFFSFLAVIFSSPLFLLNFSSSDFFFYYSAYQDLIFFLASVVLTILIQSLDGFIFLLFIISTTSPFFKLRLSGTIFPFIFAPFIEWPRSVWMA